MWAPPIAAATTTALAAAAPSVWVTDDGEKIARDATSTPFERGEDNPVWQPGGPARVFALRGESVALQVVVEAGDDPLEDVSVELPEFLGPRGARLGGSGSSREAAAREVGRPIERFVEHFVTVHRASGGRTPGESLGWQSGAGPTPGRWVRAVPDALVPVELAPAWLPYPMHVDARTNSIVWIDVNVPTDQGAGAYHGAIRVQARAHAPLAAIPVELQVIDMAMPDTVLGATAYVDPDELSERVGPEAERRAWMLLRAHRVAALHDARDSADVGRQRAALDGSLYARSNGYLGPNPGAGDPVLAIGAYGSLGDATAEALARVREVVATMADAKLLERTEVFLYADDESCSSPRAVAWREALRRENADARRVRVGWTCSERPTSQPVDIAMLLADAFDPRQIPLARVRGQEAWIYNGVLPHTGSFLTDDDAISPRVNGFLEGMFHIQRWFYWEAAHWVGDHGQTPLDPFADAESFHNDDGDWANGDGILIYPGQQGDVFPAHSANHDGVFPSVRLKNWRRGIEDAEYLGLARTRDAAKANAVARALVPRAFLEARDRLPAAWSSRGKAFFDARRALLDVALGPPRNEVTPTPLAPSQSGCSGSASLAADPGAATTSAALALLIGPVVLYLRTRTGPRPRARFRAGTPRLRRTPPGT